MAYFNSKNGCLKYTTVGEYSHDSGTTIFPNINSTLRNNADFRSKSYGNHHQKDSPLLHLVDLDMIKQFPVGDCLHLLHLGVMKRLLFGWRDGTFRRNRNQTKWRASTSDQVSKFLLSCAMPEEFQRKVRGLEDLRHWKGTEFRMFLHYIGIVILKDSLLPDAYAHFLLLFCAVTICSSKKYFNFLDIARSMFRQYVEIFKDIYGVEYVTSNVHNLIHLVDEVQLYGELDSFSSYPFENLLGKIKRSLRSGNKPLEQVANRIVEGGLHSLNKQNRIEKCIFKENLSKINNGENVPEHILMSFSSKNVTYFSKIELQDFSLSTSKENCWFLTKSNKIVQVLNIIFISETTIKLFGMEHLEKDNFLDIPIESKNLDIYSFKIVGKKKELIFNLYDIKCK